MDTNSGVTVILKDDNPCCPHGPTLLLSKKVKDKTKNFYVCSAQRDRKFCPFYLKEGGVPKTSVFWKEEALKFCQGINHRKMFILANEVKLLRPSERLFCLTCFVFIFNENSIHRNHKLLKGITDDQLMSPTEILPSSEHNKSEAQYWFTKSTVEDIVKILKSLDFSNVICIGTPRIHEYIKKNCENMSSILLDFDKRFHSFFGPLEFCWYNIFNNHFYFDEAKAVFFDYLKMNNGNNMVIITDPPFGGRTEPIAFTFKKINETYQSLNNRTDNIPLFWIYPYFMEPHIYHSNRNFSMLDYKVEYENHTAFGDGPKARKVGSPVRIFTTVKPSLIKLPEDRGYRYCEKCDRWVYEENKHCDICEACTSKNGGTYTHCEKCKRCVKPTWVHCETCRRCTQYSHHCDGTRYAKPCEYCKSCWHNKKNCPSKKVMVKTRKFKKSRAKKRKASALAGSPIEDKRIKVDTSSKEVTEDSL